MTDDTNEKSEEPSKKRLEEAREKGQITRSKELSTLILLMGGSFLIYAYGLSISSKMKIIFTESFSFDANLFKDDNWFFKHLVDVLTETIYALLPFFVGIVIFAIIGGVAVGGLGFSYENLSFKLDRLDPMQGLKKMFSLKSLIELIKSILKFILIAITFYLIVKLKFNQIFYIDHMAINPGVAFSVSTIIWSMFILSLPLVLISLIDVPFQIWSLNQKLRMTKQEVKDEFKNSEGDPHLKSKLRKMQNALRSQQMIKDIPTADVIITNPEHFAVAIKYDDTSMSTPVVVAKGLDNVAGLIKQVATANTIPIVEAPVVARTLYYNVEIGHPIPEQLYTAVARVLTYIYELNLYKRGKVNRPKLNNDFKIPPQMER